MPDRPERYSQLMALDPALLEILACPICEDRPPLREEGDTRDQLKFLQNEVGAISSPFDSFLALRGVKTLALRMERHSQNGLRIAEWLQGRPEVRRVIYPGLESHPDHATARRGPAAVSVRSTIRAFLAVTSETSTVAEEVERHTMSFEGDQSVFESFVGLLDQFDLFFPIIEP